MPVLYSWIERGGNMSTSADEELMQSEKEAENGDEAAASAGQSEIAETSAGEPVFQPGDVVVISEDFHSAYFRGLVGVVDGPGFHGATADTLYRLKIDVPPHKTIIPAKYLRLQSEAGPAAREAPGPAPAQEAPGYAPSRTQGSFWSRLFSRRK